MTPSTEIDLPSSSFPLSVLNFRNISAECSPNFSLYFAGKKRAILINKLTLAAKDRIRSILEEELSIASGWGRVGAVT